jgi:hypothetical protein
MALFFFLGPELIVEQSVEHVARTLGLQLGERGRALKPAFLVPSNRVKELLGDFAALDLMAPSKRKHPVTDKGEYWTLTECGRETYSSVRRERLEAGMPTEPEAMPVDSG